MSQQTDDPLSATKTVHDIEPSKISRAGITTERSLDWDAQRPPPVPAPEPTRDDPDGWETARKNAESKHKEQVASRRNAFQARAEDLKERFQMGAKAQTRRHQYDR